MTPTWYLMLCMFRVPVGGDTLQDPVAVCGPTSVRWFQSGNFASREMCRKAGAGMAKDQNRTSVKEQFMWKCIGVDMRSREVGEE